jgi:hypothetical protein
VGEEGVKILSFLVAAGLVSSFLIFGIFGQLRDDISIDNSIRYGGVYWFCDNLICSLRDYSHTIPIKCVSRDFQFLVGLEQQILRQKFYPPNTNIYIIGAAQNSPLAKNRLNIELNQQQIVRRVFCS